MGENDTQNSIFRNFGTQSSIMAKLWYPKSNYDKTLVPKTQMIHKFMDDRLPATLWAYNNSLK